MKKQLYLMRHGQTLFNARRKIQGWCDSPLTEKGIAQAKAMRSFFKDKDIQHVYSSTSERTFDTAHHATEGRFSITQLKGLKEMNFGVFEGESEDLHPPTIDEFMTFYANYGGETDIQVRERMLLACTEIMERDNHDRVLAVSHGGSCIHFLSHWLDPKPEIKKGVPNCTVFHYEYEAGDFHLLNIYRPEEVDVQDIISPTAHYQESEAN